MDCHDIRVPQIAGGLRFGAEAAHVVLSRQPARENNFHRHGAVEATRERARLYAQRAIDAIAVFPAGEARSAMAEAAEFAVSRRY